MMIRSFVCLRLTLAAIALTVSGVGLPVLAQTHATEVADHSHHHADATAPDAVTGPFMTDAPLRAGMSRVRNSVDALAGLSAASDASGVDRGNEDETLVLSSTAEIQSAIQFIFAECKLAPDADGALHLLLADLLQASAALNEAPSRLQPVAAMQGVLTRYDEQFHDEDAGHANHH
ncbi:MAG TPA: hypothetical protein PK159_02180 [Steroidobacteraceae bacterium]|nr:hypothetical protein [Steroidobacteraceae bacterium]